MRLFKRRNGGLNLKYIIGEVLLLFIGINLAIWFNNWNSSKKSTNDKEVAISKIVEEIDNNSLEIDSVLINNSQIIEAYREFGKYYDGSTTKVKMRPEQFNSLRLKHPGFFRAKDSAATGEGLYVYRGTTFINLELITLSEIAWKTTIALDISNEFSYECLYDLESMYNLQRRVQNEINKSANALQKKEIRELMSILAFLDQLGSHLKENYKEMLQSIENCG